MSEKRRDKKKRILRNGESQRKDGRYAYKYYDNAGNVQFVYSWKLEKGDRLPAGKRDACVHDLADGIHILDLGGDHALSLSHVTGEPAQIVDLHGTPPEKSYKTSRIFRHLIRPVAGHLPLKGKAILYLRRRWYQPLKEKAGG